MIEDVGDDVETVAARFTIVIADGNDVVLQLRVTR
jgi:hypothetical protein